MEQKVYVVTQISEGTDFYADIVRQTAFKRRDDAVERMRAEYERALADEVKEGSRIGTNDDIGAPWCDSDGAFIAVGNESCFTRLSWTLNGLDLG